MGARVNLPGWDSSRTDDDPKQVFGRFIQDWLGQGKQWGAEGVRAFAAQDPRWELQNADSNDPLLRVKQGDLDKWKPGESKWQDVIGDSGPGGQNRPQFMNADGSGSGAQQPIDFGGARPPLRPNPIRPVTPTLAQQQPLAVSSGAAGAPQVPGLDDALKRIYAALSAKYNTNV